MRFSKKFFSGCGTVFQTKVQESVTCKQQLITKPHLSLRGFQFIDSFKGSDDNQWHFPSSFDNISGIILFQGAYLLSSLLFAIQKIY